MGLMKWLIPAGIFILLIGLVNSFYTVRQDQQALILRFGDPVVVRNSPGTDEAGLYFKIPFLETVTLMDRKNIGTEVELSPAVIASDQRRLIVDAFIRWRINDPLKFYQSLRTESAANSQIGRVTDSAIRLQLGKVIVPDIISGERANLMAAIGRAVDESMTDFGIEIIDVRILQADLPQEVAQGVYQKMIVDRQREATGIRASGEEEARRIRAEAARDALVIEAQAREQAEIIKGEGDARRNEIYADAYNKDPDFFRFYRSLVACEEAIREGTRVVVSPENLNLCRVFEEQAGTR